MTPTAKSAREIIADQLESDDGKGGWAFDMEADRIIAALRARGLQIVATSAVGEVSGAGADAMDDEKLIAAMRAWGEVLRIPSGSFVNKDCAAAADRLLSLREENARLREAFLRKIQIDNGCIGTHGGWLRTMRPSENPPCDGGTWETIKCGCAIEARAALTPPQRKVSPVDLNPRGPRQSAG